MSKSLIHQHFYAKKSKGDSYETIATSPMLSSHFIKKYLQPISLYHPPKKRSFLGEQDYPAAFTLIQPETGDLIVGQAVYTPSKSIGQPSSFFVHHYIVPTNRKEEWIKNPAQLFQINHFVSSYDGKEVEEISAVPHHNLNIFARKQELFHTLHLNEQIFKQLLYACMLSVAEEKTVYISLDVPLEKQHKYAIALLELIFTFLPYPIRRVIGATTFQNEPHQKEYVHIMFVEPGSIRLRNPVLNQQFIFDFTTERFQGDRNEQNHAFLDFAYEALLTADSLDDFFIFSENALKGLPKSQKRNLSFYDQLYILYRLEKNGFYYYEENKISVLQTIRSVLGENHRDKLDIKKLLVKMLKREKQIKEEKSVIPFLQILFDIHQVVDLVEIVEITVKTLVHFHESTIEKEIWSLLESYSFTYQQVLSYMSDIRLSYPEVLASYLEDKFNRNLDKEMVLYHVEQLLSANPALEHHATFIQITRDRFVQVVRTSTEVFHDTAHIHIFLEKYVSYYRKHIYPTIQVELLKNAHVESVVMEDIKLFGKIFEVSSFGQESAERVKYDLLVALYELFFGEIDQIEKVDQVLKSPYKSKYKELGKSLLIMDEVSRQPYERLAVLFKSDRDEILHDDLFSFIAVYGTKDDMLDYIKWSFNLYGEDVSYRKSLINYLATDRNSIWKDKNVQKELKKMRSTSFHRLLKEVHYQSSNTMKRILHKVKIF